MAATSRWETLQHRRGPAAPPASLAAASTHEFPPPALEIYGPGGVAVLVDVAPESQEAVNEAARALLPRYGARLGATGALDYLFDAVGLIAYPQAGAARHELEAIAFAAGAEDVVIAPDGTLEVLTAPADLHQVERSLRDAGWPPALAAIVRRSVTEVALAPGELSRLADLLGALSRLPGVLDVWSNGTPVAASLVDHGGGTLQ